MAALGCCNLITSNTSKEWSKRLLVSPTTSVLIVRSPLAERTESSLVCMEMELSDPIVITGKGTGASSQNWHRHRCPRRSPVRRRAHHRAPYKRPHKIQVNLKSACGRLPVETSPLQMAYRFSSHRGGWVQGRRDNVGQIPPAAWKNRQAA